MFVTCYYDGTPVSSHDSINATRLDIFLKTTIKQGKVYETKQKDCDCGEKGITWSEPEDCAMIAPTFCLGTFLCCKIWRQIVGDIAELRRKISDFWASGVAKMYSSGYLRRGSCQRGIPQASVGNHHESLEED